MTSNHPIATRATDLNRLPPRRKLGVLEAARRYGSRDLDPDAITAATKAAAIENEIQQDAPPDHSADKQSARDEAARRYTPTERTP